MRTNNVSRRNFLKKAATGAYALSAGTLINACMRVSDTDPLPENVTFDIEILLEAVIDHIQILPGKTTEVWRYHGEVIKGPDTTINQIPNSYLGPILRFKKNQTVRIIFQNTLEETSIIHWHGLHVPESADGHPRFVINPGEEYVYEFKVMDRAGTYWYHPHPHGRTGPQVYRGLAGLIIISDDEESALNLPNGEYDIPIVIQDRTFDDQNQLEYGEAHMSQMMGFFGDRILINGQTNNALSVENRPYRLRLLNGSNARIYQLAWQDLIPFTIISTDGGLLEKPIEKQFVILAPAQRIDLWMDFSQFKIGDSIQLMNVPNSTPGGNTQFNVMTFNIERQSSSTSSLPENLSVLDLYAPNNAVNTANPRNFDLSMGMGMVWTINGRTFEMEKFSPDETVQMGDLEIWQFTNTGGQGMGMVLPHPMHIHGLQFQIIGRDIDDRLRETWQSVSRGFVDQGWHDTVLVMPGEKVRVLMKFEDFEGLYLYHCHNLEHEDMGMMRNFQISA